MSLHVPEAVSVDQEPPQAIFLLHSLSSDGKEFTDLLSDQTGRVTTSILGVPEAFIQIMLMQDNLDE